MARIACLALGLIGTLSAVGHGSQVTTLFHGIVETTFFSAEDVFPLNTPLDFVVRYENDPQLNPDRNPLDDSGSYRLTHWELRNFGSTSGGTFSDVQVINADVDRLGFSIGSITLPPLTTRRGSYSFNSARITLADPSGTSLLADGLPQSVERSDWPSGSFQMRWGGADGPTISGSLQIVPEPTCFALLLPLAAWSIHWSRSKGLRPVR